MIKVFISYAHADEHLKIQLDRHLSILVNNGTIAPWHDRMLIGGDDFASKIDAYLDEADVILLLVSHNFLSSNYCYGIEMKRALEREEQGDARVVPVILDHCLWKEAPFGHLVALPKDGKPVTKFPNVNEGFTDVATGILKVAKSMVASRLPSHQDTATAPIPPVALEPVIEFAPRSTNLHVKSEVTQRQKDQFVIAGFSYIEKFFENSLEELRRRNPQARLETHFEKVDSGTFYAAIYKEGDKVSECTIARTQVMMGSIAYSRNSTPPRNSMNDSLTVEVVDGALGFRPIMGRMMGRRGSSDELGMEGAAKYYWDILMEPLQR